MFELAKLLLRFRALTIFRASLFFLLRRARLSTKVPLLSAPRKKTSHGSCPCGCTLSSAHRVAPVRRGIVVVVADRSRDAEEEQIECKEQGNRDSRAINAARLSQRLERPICGRDLRGIACDPRVQRHKLLTLHRRQMPLLQEP